MSGFAAYLRRRTIWAVLCPIAWGIVTASHPAAASPSLAKVVNETQPKFVKIYGAGGFRGLESYQSGFLISDSGHVLTVWSYVLDTDYVTVVLNDGRRFQADLVGADPLLEIAVLKIDEDTVSYFDLHDSVQVEPGARILAFSNLFGIATGNEPVSVLHGNVAIKAPLAARRGAFQVRYQGPVYVLDAMTNNPGAAGGAITDRQGHLAGLLGKEIRNSLSNTWLNYAVPISELISAVDDIVAGKLRPSRPLDDPGRYPEHPQSTSLLGLVLVPDVLDKTPPFIDRILPGSPAEEAGLQPDDLVLFVGEYTVQSCKTLKEQLLRTDRRDPVKLVVLRGDELIEFSLQLQLASDSSTP